MSENPWKTQAHARITEFGDHGGPEDVAEHRMTEFEYQGTEDLARPCHKDGCDGTLHYKASIGALKCGSCGALARTNGDPVR